VHEHLWRLHAAQQAAKAAHKELQQLQKEVVDTEQELAAKREQLHEQKEAEKALEGKLDDAKAQKEVSTGLLPLSYCYVSPAVCQSAMVRGW
jgi:uncharacterized protein (DUF3084 family)